MLSNAFAVDAPGPTNQGWWCRALQWFCDASDALHATPHDVPEIHGATIALGIALAVGGLLIANRKRNTPR